MITNIKALLRKISIKNSHILYIEETNVRKLKNVRNSDNYSILNVDTSDRFERS